MTNQVRVSITTLDGEVLEMFTVTSGNVRQHADPHGVAIEHMARDIRDHVEHRFEVQD
jgi:hypothetical protein